MMCESPLQWPGCPYLRDFFSSDEQKLFIKSKGIISSTERASILLYCILQIKLSDRCS